MHGGWQFKPSPQPMFLRRGNLAHSPVYRLETRRCGVKTYMCVICGFIYDEAKGLPEEGIAPGTKWEDVPLNWVCPECGAGKDDFELMEI
jgi:rubredoxin